MSGCVWMADVGRVVGAHDSSAGRTAELFRNIQEENFRLPSEPVIWNSAQHEPLVVKLSYLLQEVMASNSSQKSTKFQL